MPRPAKKPKSKAPRGSDLEGHEPGQPNGPATATALAEPPRVEERRPQVPVVEPTPEPERSKSQTSPREKGEKSQAEKDKDRIAASLNIAKLQGMSMTELNQMARE